MPNHPCVYRQPQLPPLLGGCLAVALLWFLALWNLGSPNDIVGSDAGRHSVVASQDMPLHANSEHSLSLKRFFSRNKSASKSADIFPPADSVWSFPSTEYIAALLPLVAQQNNSAIDSPLVYLHQLQALNAPRAPPLV